jgi:hypothetical protein
VLTGLVLVFAAFARFGPTGGYAAPVSSSSPPPPPTFVPTPIGPPPGPPSATATPTTRLITPVGTSTASVTPTAAPTSSNKLSFSLDAARVSKPNNPGNLVGLAAVKRGSKVWLMMYYTVRSLPKTMTRVTKYSIAYRGKTVFQKSFQTKIKRTEIGRFSRFWPYAVPPSWPYGAYIYKARLTIGKISRTKSWKFTLAQHNREATTGQG